MDTLLLEIRNDKAYKLIENLEALNIVKVLKKSSKATKQNLSDRFAGALKLTDKQYQDFQNQGKEMRNEWERDI